MLIHHGSDRFSLSLFQPAYCNPRALVAHCLLSAFSDGPSTAILSLSGHCEVMRGVALKEAITAAEHRCVLRSLHRLGRRFGAMAKARGGHGSRDMGLHSGQGRAHSPRWSVILWWGKPILIESQSTALFVLGLKHAPRHIWMRTCASLKVYVSQAWSNSLDDIKDILFPLWVSRRAATFQHAHAQDSGIGCTACQSKHKTGEGLGQT